MGSPHRDPITEHFEAINVKGLTTKKENAAGGTKHTGRLNR